MEMNVILSIGAFIGKPRLIIVVDRGALRIEQVEGFQLNAKRWAYFVSDAAIKRGRRLGSNAVFLDERARPEVAEL